MKKEIVIRKSVSMPKSIFREIETKAFSENNGNFSVTLVQICRAYLSTLKLKPNE